MSNATQWFPLMIAVVADGDLALNLTLTASNAMLAIIPIPLILAVNRVDTAGA